MSIEAKNNSFFLDFLLVIAKNMKIVLCAAILAGALVWTWSTSKPATYVSHTLISLHGSESPLSDTLKAATVLKTPALLDMTIKDLKINETPDSFSGRISTNIGRDGLLRVEMRDTSPAGAQRMLTSLINNWRAYSRPTDDNRASLEKRLSYAQSALEQAKGLMAIMTKEVASNGDNTSAKNAETLMHLAQTQSKYLEEIQQVTWILRGITEDAIIQPATLPTSPLALKTSQIVTFTVLITSLFILFCAFLFNAWKNASRQPELAEKQRELLSALPFSRLFVRN